MQYMPTLLGKEYGTNYGVKVEKILNAPFTPHCLSRIISIIDF
jgi:hypothetical protein